MTTACTFCHQPIVSVGAAGDKGPVHVECFHKQSSETLRRAALLCHTYDNGKFTNDELADILIERLNKLIEDPEVRADISNLIEIRMPVNKTTRQHPTLQVVDGMFLGTLGLINGLVGVIPDGPRKDWGYIAADFDDENKLVKFLRTPMPRETNAEPG